MHRPGIGTEITPNDLLDHTVPDQSPLRGFDAGPVLYIRKFNAINTLAKENQKLSNGGNS